MQSDKSTEQHQIIIRDLEKELNDYKHASAHFECIFNAIPDAAVFADQEGRIVMANPAVEKTFGYKPGEVIGKTTEIFYPGRKEYEEQGRVRFDLAVEANQKSYKMKCRRENNNTFLSEIFEAPVKDKAGNILGFLFLMRDISERKRRKDMLRKALVNYSTIADFTYDWEYWVNPEGEFLYVSPSCERITGYKPAQFIEDSSLLRKITHPDDKSLFDQHVDESHKEIGQREIQYRIKRADGEVCWIEHACLPVTGKHGEYLGFRATNRDITLRKEMEEELLSALAEIRKLKDQLEVESNYLRHEIDLEHNYKNIIGNSNALQYVLFKVEQIAATDTNVIIFGETGTGKELIARAIHNTSNRKKRPLVKINCAALPANLIESELFGHEKGAYTSAHEKYIGRFEVANGASIFLDEIGELPLDLQAKLLRILQDGEFERLGSTRTRKVNVRVIAATNRELEKDVEAGRFRKDLWYRLNVFPITVPPLRDRAEDIPLIVNHFVEKFGGKQGKEITLIPESVMVALQNYPWPGNVRELENVIERAVINTPGNRLKLAEGLKAAGNMLSNKFKPLRDMEREYIVAVLNSTNWKVSGKKSAAEILQIDRSTLRARMKKLGIQRP